MNSQKGLTPVVTIILVIILLFIGSIAYVIVSSISKAGKNVQNTNPSDNNTEAVKKDECALKDKELCIALGRLNNPTTYYPGSFFIATRTTTPSKVTNNQWESDGNGNVRMMNFEELRKIDDTIIIGNNIYLLDLADNTWYKNAKDPAVSEPIEKFKESVLRAVKDQVSTIPFKRLETEACGKVTCYKYQFSDPKNPDTINYIFFDTEYYQFRKQYVKLSDGTIIESNLSFNKVTITEPSPLK